MPMEPAGLAVGVAHEGSAVPLPPPGNIIPVDLIRRPATKISDVSEDLLSVSDMKEELIDNKIFRYEKAIVKDGLDDFSQPRLYGWDQAIRTEDQNISKKTAQEKIRELNYQTKNVLDKKNVLTPSLKRQLDKTLEELMSQEFDLTNFHWSLAQIDHELRAVDGYHYTSAHQPARGHRHSSYRRSPARRPQSRSSNSRPHTKKRVHERISLTAYFQRVPRPGVNIPRLWEEKKKGVDNTYPSYPGETFRPIHPNHKRFQNQGPTQQQQPPNNNQVPMVGISEHVTSSDSEFDSGYKSLSAIHLANQNLDSIDEIGHRVDLELYSEAGSLERRTDNYSQYLAEEVVSKLSEELKHINWACFRTVLSELLQEFAIRVANEGQTQNHRDLMYWTHKWHDNIVRCIENRGLSNDLDDEDTLRKQDYNPDWRDRIGLLLNKEDQNDERDIAPTAEGKFLSPVEIEPYQQIISRSRAFEWLVSAIRNRTVLGTISDNTMRTVRQDILSQLDLVDRNRGHINARISRHRNPMEYRVRFTLCWPTAKMYQEGDLFKTLSDVVERVLTFTGDETKVQALTCEDYINQTWPTTGPLLIQSILGALNRSTKGDNNLTRSRDDLFTIQISGGLMQVHSYGNAFELAEVGTQLAWLASALYPGSIPKQGVICNPRVCFGRSSLDENSKHREESEDLSCIFEFETTIIDPEKEYGTNGNCWQTLMNNFVVVKGFPIRSRFSGIPGLEVPLDIAADFVGTRKVIRFKGRPLIKGFSTMLCPISRQAGIVYWHVLKCESERISYADARVDDMSTIEPGSLTLRDLESSRHIVGWCTEVKNHAGTIDANLDIRRTDLKEPPNEWALNDLRVGGGQYISVLATFAVRKGQKALRIERDRSDYNGNMEWIAQRYVILHDTEASERRAWLIDGASALLHLVFASLWKNQHGVLKNSYTFDMKSFAQFFNNDATRMAASLAVLTNAKFLGTRLRTRDPMNNSNGYLLRDRVDEIFDLLAQMIDHQEDINSDNGLGRLVSLAPWKRHVGWAFADVISPGEPCRLKTTYLKKHGEGWVYFARELHAVTLFGCGFGDILQPSLVSPNPCTRCLWESLAPKGFDILAVSLEDLKLHSESSDQRRVEVRCIINQRFFENSSDSCFRVCSRGNCRNQRIQLFHKTPGRGYDPSWTETSLLKLDEGCARISGAALLGVRSKLPKKRKKTKKNQDRQQSPQLHIEPDEASVRDDFSTSNNQSTSQAFSQASAQMTSITPPTSGSSTRPTQPNSPANTDEGMRTTSHRVGAKNPFRKVQESTNNLVRRFRS